MKPEKSKKTPTPEQIIQQERQTRLDRLDSVLSGLFEHIHPTDFFADLARFQAMAMDSPTYRMELDMPQGSTIPLTMERAVKTLQDCHDALGVIEWPR